MKKKFHKNPRIGKCYQLAGKYALESDNPETRLVHGVIHSPSPDAPIPVLKHAWIEEGNEVYDPVLDRRWPKDIYYSCFRAIPKNILSKEEVKERVFKTGYWDLEERR